MGHKISILLDDSNCWVDVDEKQDIYISDYDGDVIRITRDEAIAAARAILKHFNVGVE